MKIVKIETLATISLIFVFIMVHNFAAAAKRLNRIRPFTTNEPQFEARIVNGTLERLGIFNGTGRPCKIWDDDRHEVVLIADVEGVNATKNGWNGLTKNLSTMANLTGIQYFNVESENVMRDLVNDTPPYINSVNLYDLKVKRLDRNVLINNSTSELNIVGSDIIDIAEGAIDMPNLERFSLKYSRVSDTKFVATLPRRLKLLDLGKNSIRKISSRIFLNRENLNDLLLAFNFINIIEAGAFYDLDNLKRLDMEFNLMNRIESGVFAGMRSLNQLNLRGNPITTIALGSFDLPDLQTLNLVGSMAEVVHGKVMEVHGGHKCEIIIGRSMDCMRNLGSNYRACDHLECSKYSGDKYGKSSE